MLFSTAGIISISKWVLVDEILFSLRYHYKDSRMDEEEHCTTRAFGASLCWKLIVAILLVQCSQQAIFSSVGSSGEEPSQLGLCNINICITSPTKKHRSWKKYGTALLRLSLCKYQPAANRNNYSKLVIILVS